MKLIKVSLVLLISCASCTTDIKCIDYQTGKFDLNDDRIGVHTVIERDKHFQIETNVANGNKTKCAVRWLNDCTYVLTYLESESEILKPLIGTELTIEIKQIEGEKVHFTAMLDGYTEKPSFFMTKID